MKYCSVPRIALGRTVVNETLWYDRDMQPIKTFNPENATPEEVATYQKRQSTRAIAFDSNGDIALIYSEKLGYYTLPGGTIDPGETPDQAIVRECKEEIGCVVEIEKLLGSVIEVRKNHGKIGEVIGYIVNVIGEKGIPELMDDEIEEGFVVKWVSPDEAKRLFHQELERESVHVHIPKRALAFLEAAFPEQG